MNHPNNHPFIQHSDTKPNNFMKRTFLFFAVIVVIIALGLVLKHKYIDRKHTSLEIASTDNWRSILIGKWDFKLRTEGPRNKEEQDGIFEFNADTTFVAYLNCQQFKDGSELKPFRIFGGKIAGKYFFYNKTFNFYAKECSLSITFSEFPNDSYQPCPGTIRYGEFNDNKIVSQILQFNENMLKFHEMDYSNNDSSQVTFTRKR